MGAREIVRLPDGIPIMSRSALEAALCGHRYRALYVNGLADESPFSLRGSAYHAVKRRYVERLAAAQVSSDHEEAVAAFDEGITLSRCPPQLVPEVRDIFERHVLHFQLDLEKFIAAEHKRVRMDAPMPYQYEPDLEYMHFHENMVEIFDDKSYYRGFTAAQARELVQTRFYVWAAMQEFPGVETFRFTYNFVRINQSVSTDFTRTDHGEEIHREIRAMEAVRQDRHDEDDWAAEPGDACAFCHLACPVMDDAQRAFIRVNDAVSFRAVAGAKMVMEKTLKMMTEGLKRYANAEGPQEVNGEVFAFRPTASKSYPIGPVVDAIRLQGEEPSSYVSASALKGDLKRFQHLAEDLAPVLHVKDSARFGHKSVKADLAARVEFEQDGDDDAE